MWKATRTGYLLAPRAEPISARALGPERHRIHIRAGREADPRRGATWMIPSEPASANPRRAAITVSVDADIDRRDTRTSRLCGIEHGAVLVGCGDGHEGPLGRVIVLPTLIAGGNSLFAGAGSTSGPATRRARQRLCPSTEYSPASSVHSRPFGGVTERTNVTVSKTVGPFGVPRVQSLPLRHRKGTRKGAFLAVLPTATRRDATTPEG